MAEVTFSIDFGGGFSVRQSVSRRNDNTIVSGSFHRLTPEQFDALISVFPVTSETRTLTTDGRHGAPRNFRTADINIGGLDLTLFSNLPDYVDANQLSLEV